MNTASDPAPELYFILIKQHDTDPPKRNEFALIKESIAEMTGEYVRPTLETKGAMLFLSFSSPEKLKECIEGARAPSTEYLLLKLCEPCCGKGDVYEKTCMKLGKARLLSGCKEQK